ncbi:MAG: flagellar basal body-associated FliL family protein [Rhodospirillales bacterium]|nr:flagellar basal body-associated FliL family protein [Rhodospirillales bacterium]
MADDDDATEDDDPEEMDGEEEESGGGKKKLIIIIVIALLVLGGGGGAAYFFLAGGDDAKKQEEAKKDEPPAPPVYHEFPQILVDLKTKRGRSRFLKLKVMAEMGAQEDLATMKSYEPKIIDGFQTFLREQDPKSLSGREGTEKMREAFLGVAQGAIGAKKVKAILFREILLQ